jgi:hypothetical protein
MSTNQKPPRNSCWCWRTISRKRRRTRLRTTAPPIRREVTNPERDGTEFSTGATFNIRSLPRRVVPSRVTRSYSDRCLSRRLFGKQNEPLGVIWTGNPHTIIRLIPRRTSFSRCVRCVTSYKRSLPPKPRWKTSPKNEIEQPMNPVTRQVFPLFQPAIPLSQQELRFQRDS